MLKILSSYQRIRKNGTGLYRGNECLLYTLLATAKPNCGSFLSHLHLNFQTQFLVWLPLSVGNFGCKKCECNSEINPDFKTEK